VPKRIVTIRFSEPEYQFISYFAEKWGVSISDAIRLILHEFIGMNMVLSNMPQAKRTLMAMMGLEAKE